MSDPVSALNNATFDTGIAVIREIGPLGMISLRADLTSKEVRRAVTGVSGVEFPDNNSARAEGDNAIAWMSPDEVLVMCRYGQAADTVAKMQSSLGEHHALVANVSDARAVFEVSGPNAREVMAKLAPVDLDPAQFTPGMFRRTRMAQVAAAFWMRDADVFQVICFRSNARYMFDLLSVAAQPGSEVGHF